jgi:hypothetical protein
MVGHYVTRLRDQRHRQAMRTARAGLRLPRRPRAADPRGAVWAVAMVKNEADIVGATVRHLLEQGVDRVLVVDNRSTDSTRELLTGLAGDGRVILGEDLETAYLQAAKMTLLVRYAARHGASWVVPFDADELWFAPELRLADFLRASDAMVARADIYNVFPNGDGGWRLDPTPHELRKVAYRPHPMALLQMGNHWTSRAGVIDTRLRIAHVPWRSQEQLVRKLRQGAVAFSSLPAESHVGAHWLRAGTLDDRALAVMWEDVVAGLPSDTLGWSPSGKPMRAVDPFAWDRWPSDIGHR